MTSNYLGSDDSHIIELPMALYITTSDRDDSLIRRARGNDKTRHLGFLGEVPSSQLPVLHNLVATEFQRVSTIHYTGWPV